MPRSDGPIWPLTVNVVRVTLARSDVATLHKPEIRLVGWSDYYGWARYSACISWLTFSRYPTQQQFYLAVTNAFCEPMSDFHAGGSQEGVNIAFTLYVNEDAQELRNRSSDMHWNEWAFKFFNA